VRFIIIANVRGVAGEKPVCSRNKSKLSGGAGGA
jgi:hypothetical protein